MMGLAGKKILLGVSGGIAAYKAPELVRRLRDRGYEGFVSLEPHLASGHELGGFSGPIAFGEAARALRAIAEIGRAHV